MRRHMSYIDVDEALDKALRGVDVKMLPPEFVPIQEAYDRVIADSIVSPINIPPYDSSHRDGYAVIAEDTANASVEEPVFLKVKGEIDLGEKPSFEIGSGEAAKIPTGGLLPDGADAIVMEEYTHLMKGDRIRLRNQIHSGEHVIPAGRDVEKGEKVFLKGHILRPQDIGLLAMLGIGRVEVIRRPVVSIISIGDELTEEIEETREGEVVASHSLVISKMVEKIGGLPIDLGVVPDDLTEIKSRTDEGLNRSDLILTIGSSWVGERDYLSDVIDSMGEPGLIVHGIKRKPGKVSGVGLIEDKPIVMLPGLIQSSIVGFITFALPIIRLMQGLPEMPSCPTIDARLAEEVLFNGFIPFQKVTFVKIKRNDEGFTATPLFGESALISVLTGSDGFFITPSNKAIVEKGEKVEVNLLPGSTLFVL